MQAVEWLKRACTLSSPPPSRSPFAALRHTQSTNAVSPFHISLCLRWIFYFFIFLLNRGHFLSQIARLIFLFSLLYMARLLNFLFVCLKDKTRVCLCLNPLSKKLLDGICCFKSSVSDRRLFFLVTLNVRSFLTCQGLVGK